MCLSQTDCVICVCFFCKCCRFYSTSFFIQQDQNIIITKFVWCILKYLPSRLHSFTFYFVPPLIFVVVCLPLLLLMSSSSAKHTRTHTFSQRARDGGRRQKTMHIVNLCAEKFSFHSLRYCCIGIVKHIERNVTTISITHFPWMHLVSRLQFFLRLTKAKEARRGTEQKKKREEDRKGKRETKAARRIKQNYRKKERRRSGTRKKTHFVNPFERR